MRRLFCLTVCAIFMTSCCSGVTFSQFGGSADPDMRQQLLDDLQMMPTQIQQFGQSLQPLMEEMQKNMQAKIMEELPKRMADTSSPMTQEDGMRLGTEIAIDEMAALQQPINEKFLESFSEAQHQKMHTRMFQMRQGIMERLDSVDSSEFMEGAMMMETTQLMVGQPGFLELTPEQNALIFKQQKETAIKGMSLMAQEDMNPEKAAERQRLYEELHKAETDEQREVLENKIRELQLDALKKITPQLKEILKEGHENFMRTLTDAQRAKIKTVMAEMPDYLKKQFDEFDKTGSGLSGLESWVPGMGAPGVNPNREPPRQRSGGRAFPE